MSSLHAIVLAGDGINCQKESADACRDVGFETQTIHINDFLANASSLRDCDLLVLPGGFSFGDELGSGRVCALKLKFGLKNDIQSYLDRGGAVLGICNGFQILTQWGIFGSDVSLNSNIQGRFLNRWVDLDLIGRSLFTDYFLRSGIRKISLPVRHGEGRLQWSSSINRETALAQGRAVLRYSEDINGSDDQIAGLAAYGGRVLGLMPHPEAFWSAELHPEGYVAGKKVPLGLQFFSNAHRALSEDEEWKGNER